LALSLMTLWTGLKQQQSASDDTIGPTKEKEEEEGVFSLPSWTWKTNCLSNSNVEYIGKLSD